jgi:hypothetical protein
MEWSSGKAYAGCRAFLPDALHGNFFPFGQYQKLKLGWKVHQAQQIEPCAMRADIRDSAVEHRATIVKNDLTRFQRTLAGCLTRQHIGLHSKSRGLENDPAISGRVMKGKKNADEALRLMLKF